MNEQVGKHRFEYKSAKYLDIQASYYALGAIRKLFNPKSRREGEPLSPLSLKLQKMAFGLTRLVDRWVPARKDLTLMMFTKQH